MGHGGSEVRGTHVQVPRTLCSVALRCLPTCPDPPLPMASAGGRGEPPSLSGAPSALGNARVSVPLLRMV